MERDYVNVTIYIGRLLFDAIDTAGGYCKSLPGIAGSLHWHNYSFVSDKSTHQVRAASIDINIMKHTVTKKQNIYRSTCNRRWRSLQRCYLHCLCILDHKATNKQFSQTRLFPTVPRLYRLLINSWQFCDI